MKTRQSDSLEHNAEFAKVLVEPTRKDNDEKGGRKAWITTDEEYPVYCVSLTPTADLSATEVTLTRKQVKLVRFYKGMKERYEAMCKELIGNKR